MATDFSRTLRSLQADGSRPAWLAWGAAGLLGLAWGLWFLAGRVSVYEPALQARVEAQAAAHPVAARQGGTLVTSTLALGRTVRAGELLLELDHRGAALRLREERARLDALPPRRAALQAEIDAGLAADAQARLAGAQALAAAQQRAEEAAAPAAFAREQATRLAAEVPGGGVAEIDALRARSEATRLAAQQRAAQAEVARLAAEERARDAQALARQAVQRGQLAALASEAQALAASVDRLDAELERARVRAPVDGVLAEVTPLRPGAWLAEGQAVATVLAPGGLTVVADFAPQRALGRLQPGQMARVRLDSLPWIEHGSLAARVLHVAGEPRDGRLRVELAIDPAGPALPLQHGLTGTVEVALEQVAPVQLLLRTLGRRLQP